MKDNAVHTDLRKQTRSVPTLYTKREDCCGCFSCYAKCPRDAIAMQEDEEGFMYPVVNKGKCVRCYQCETVCPIKHSDQEADV